MWECWCQRYVFRERNGKIWFPWESLETALHSHWSIHWDLQSKPLYTSSIPYVQKNPGLPQSSFNLGYHDVFIFSPKITSDFCYFCSICWQNFLQIFLKNRTFFFFSEKISEETKLFATYFKKMSGLLIKIWRIFLFSPIFLCPRKFLLKKRKSSR